MCVDWGLEQITFLKGKKIPWIRSPDRQEIFKRRKASHILQRKEDFGKQGEMISYLAGALWMFNRHSLLHSGRLCK